MNLTEQFWHTFRKQLFQTFDSFCWSFKKQSSILKKKNFTSRKSSGNSTSFSDKTAWSFSTKAGLFLAQQPKKLLELNFLSGKNFMEILYRTRRLKFSVFFCQISENLPLWTHCQKYLNSSIEQRKEIIFFHTKVSSIFSLENWHGLPTKLLKMFHQETEFFRFGIKNSKELKIFPKN